MLKTATVKVFLDQNPNGSIYKGGDNISGVAVVSVPEGKQLELLSLDLEVLCDVKISIGDDRAIQDDRSPSEDLHHRIRYYTKDIPLVSHTTSLGPGKHQFSFSSLLPENNPPSYENEVATMFYGGVIHAVQVTARRSTKSLFKKKELKSRAVFKYKPLQIVPEFEDRGVQMSDRVVTQHFREKQHSTLKELAGVASKRSPEPKNEVYCHLKYPTSGFRQDRPNSLSLHFIPADRSSPITMKDFSLNIETSLVVKSGHARREAKLFLAALTDKSAIGTQSGDTIDLTPFLQNLTFKELLEPTFKTFKLALVHNLRIEAVLTREGQNGPEIANFYAKVPVVLLPPDVEMAPTKDYSYTDDSANNNYDGSHWLTETGYIDEKKDHENASDNVYLNPGPPVSVTTNENSQIKAPPSYYR